MLIIWVWLTNHEKRAKKNFFCANCKPLCRKPEEVQLKRDRASAHTVWASEGQFQFDKACSSWYWYCFTLNININFACQSITHWVLGRKQEELRRSDQISEKIPAPLRSASITTMEMYIPLVKTLITSESKWLIPHYMSCTTCRMEKDAKPKMADGANDSKSSPDGWATWVSAIMRAIG